MPSARRGAQRLYTKPAIFAILVSAALLPRDDAPRAGRVAVDGGGVDRRYSLPSSGILLEAAGVDGQGVRFPRPYRSLSDPCG